MLQRLLSKTLVQHHNNSSYFLIYLCIIISTLLLFGCGSTQNEEVINTNATQCHDKFVKKAYNKPYTIKGEKHHPQKHYEYNKVGIASYYGGGDVFHGRKTSNGEVFDMDRLSAAHKTLPIPCIVLVTNLENGRSLKLKINDRGPFIGERIIDVSRKSARLLGFENKGLAKVRVQTLVSESIILANNMAHGKHKPMSSHNDIMLAQSEPQELPQPHVVAPPSLKGSKRSRGMLAQQQSIGLQSTAHDPAQCMDQLVKLYQDDDHIQNVSLPVVNTKQRSLHQVKHTQQLGSSAARATYSSTQNSISVGAKGKTIEIGTYKHLAQAKKIAARLNAYDPQLPVQLYSSTLGQQSLYRVVVGPVSHNTNTSRLLQQISAKVLPLSR